MRFPAEFPERGTPKERGDTLVGHLGFERQAGKLASGVPMSRGVEHSPDSCRGVFSPDSWKSPVRDPTYPMRFAK